MTVWTGKSNHFFEPKVLHGGTECSGCGEYVHEEIVFMHNGQAHCFTCTTAIASVIPLALSIHSEAHKCYLKAESTLIENVYKLDDLQEAFDEAMENVFNSIMGLAEKDERTVEKKEVTPISANSYLDDLEID